MSLIRRALQSRYSWFLQGLPVVSRSQAMFRIRNHTMTTPVRCRQLWSFCQDVIARDVPGAFVECGVWRGGSAGMMALAARAAGARRKLHLFDSFEGLPEPGEQDGTAAAEYSGQRAGNRMESIGRCVAGLDHVKDLLLGSLRLPDEDVVFHQGWFQDTVPQAAPTLGPIAILRLDGDWYESTRVCLEHLYPLLSPGGYVLMDDYFAWEGCAKATDEYRERHGISTPITRIDVDSAFWIRSA